MSKRHSSGGKEKLGSISKRGDCYLRAYLPPERGRDPLYQDPWHEAYGKLVPS